MNVLPLFELIRKFCADSQNQEPSLDWVHHGGTQMGWSLRGFTSQMSGEPKSDILLVERHRHDERVNPYLATFSKHGELGRSKSRMGATSSGPLDGAS